MSKPGNYDAFQELLAYAKEKAARTETEVMISDDENGVWQEIFDDDSGFVPCLMLGVGAGGSVRIVDNNGEYEKEEPWRR